MLRFQRKRSKPYNVIASIWQAGRGIHRNINNHRNVIRLVPIVFFNPILLMDNIHELISMFPFLIRYSCECFR